MANFRKESIAKLAEKCRLGDETAWDDLIRQITPYIFSICHRMNLNREESFDIFGQVTFILLNNLENVKSTKSLLGFIGTTTRREIFQTSRRYKLFQSYENEIINKIYGSEIKGPDKIVEENERSTALLKAVAQLPKKEYELIYYLFFSPAKLSYEDISRKLEIPVASIGPTRLRCFKKLKKLLGNKVN